MWTARPLDPQQVRLLRRLCEKHDLRPLVIHTNYLINLAASNPLVRTRSIEAFRGELERAVTLEADFLVMHPGSARAGDRREALVRFILGVEEVARGLKLGRLRVLVENTAGGGSSLASDLEELREMLRLLRGVPAGCCIDTAHCYQAGFDLATAVGLETALERLEETIGLDSVHVIHVSDSRTRRGSRADRHEHIGRGGIGLPGFRRILNHPRLRDKPFILETPIERDGDDLRNLEVIRRLCRTGTGARFKVQGPKRNRGL
jgi:deoxyribonuclease-4